MWTLTVRSTEDRGWDIRPTSLLRDFVLDMSAKSCVESQGVALFCGDLDTSGGQIDRKYRYIDTNIGNSIGQYLRDEINT